MKKLIAVLILSNVAWFAAYVWVDIKRDEANDLAVKADAAIKSLPHPETYFLGQEQNGDLIVMCQSKADPTVRGAETATGYNLLDITCGK